MEKAQYAIMRFAKYKGPEIGNIEAHNERTKAGPSQRGKLPLPDAVPGKTVSV